MAMAKFNERNRKVRFNLPEIKTVAYDNRQIVNIIPKNQLKCNEKSFQQKYKPISIRILPPITFLKPYKKISDNTRNDKYKQNNVTKTVINTKLSHFTKPITFEISKSSSTDNNQHAKHLVILNGTPNRNKQLNEKYMQDNLTICEYFSRFRIFEDILKQKRKSLKLSEKADRKIIYLKPLRTSVPDVPIKNFLHSTETHSRTLADLIQRLKRMRLRETELKINNNILVTTRKDPMESAVLFRTFKPLDVVKRFGSFKMSLEREPTIPTLLRAARDGDTSLLKIIFKKILNDGIKPDVLNKTDQCGRTALSYICSMGLTSFLDLLLQIKGIDVNIGDNEGNTPLHYAAEAGQSEIINMMLTRCRSIQIDAQNSWGFTPLMNAALQGKTRCAKLLLFAGASPSVTDNSRSLNASEWARFTGRESCAEMLEKCATARNLKQSVSSKQTYQYNQKNINNIQRSNSLLSKLNKFIPFKSSIKDKQTGHNHTVILKNNITIDVHTQTLESYDLGKDGNVPKLVITEQNDIELIKKYEMKQIQKKYFAPPKRQIRNEI